MTRRTDLTPVERDRRADAYGFAVAVVGIAAVAAAAIGVIVS